MTLLAASDMSSRDRHRLMTATVVPRPIAWVLSVDSEGHTNLAPFSYFNAICARPPLVSIAIGHKRDGERKDTRVNIEETEAFVIHVVDEATAHVMVDSSAPMKPDESEVDALGLQTTPSAFVHVPRLVDAPVAMECRLHDIYTPPGASSDLVIGEILAWHVRDGLLTDDAARPVDIHRLRPVARLGADDYCPVREVFPIERP